MDLADIMVNLPYKWTFLSDWSKYIFIYASGILPSPEWILEEERRHWNLSVKKMAINLPSRKIKEDFSFRELYSILYLTNCTNVLEFVYFDFVYPP